MISKDLMVMVMISFLSKGSVSEEFCSAFNGNSFAIDFGFNNVMNERFLFIGQNYWRLKNKWVGPKLRLELESKTSNEINWFGSQSRPTAAFEIRFCSYVDITEICRLMVGLLNMNQGQSRASSYPINWSPIDFDIQRQVLEKSREYERYVANTTQIDLKDDFKPSLGFALLGEYACFVQQKKSENKYSRTFRCFHFDSTGNSTHVTDVILWALKMEMKKSGIKYGPDQTILNDLSDTRNLIAVFYDFHLFAENNVITYCPSHSFFFHLGCKEEAQVLIDCSKSQVTEGMPQNSSTLSMF